MSHRCPTCKVVFNKKSQASCDRCKPHDSLHHVAQRLAGKPQPVLPDQSKLGDRFDSTQ